jgi:hypothetical protein
MELTSDGAAICPRCNKRMEKQGVVDHYHCTCGCCSWGGFILTWFPPLDKRFEEHNEEVIQ